MLGACNFCTIHKSAYQLYLQVCIQLDNLFRDLQVLSLDCLDLIALLQQPGLKSAVLLGQPVNLPILLPDGALHAKTVFLVSAQQSSSQAMSRQRRMRMTSKLIVENDCGPVCDHALACSVMLPVLQH